MFRSSSSPLHNLLQNGVGNRVMKKQKSDYSINGVIFYCLCILYFPLHIWSKLWSGDGDALRYWFWRPTDGVALICCQFINGLIFYYLNQYKILVMRLCK